VLIAEETPMKRVFSERLRAGRYGALVRRQLAVPVPTPRVGRPELHYEPSQAGRPPLSPREQAAAVVWPSAAFEGFIQGAKYQVHGTCELEESSEGLTLSVHLPGQPEQLVSLTPKDGNLVGSGADAEWTVDTQSGLLTCKPTQGAQTVLRLTGGHEEQALASFRGARAAIFGAALSSKLGEVWLSPQTRRALSELRGLELGHGVSPMEFIEELAAQPELSEAQALQMPLIFILGVSAGPSDQVTRLFRENMTVVAERWNNTPASALLWRALREEAEAGPSVKPTERQLILAAGLFAAVFELGRVDGSEASMIKSMLAGWRFANRLASRQSRTLYDRPDVSSSSASIIAPLSSRAVQWVQASLPSVHPIQPTLRRLTERAADSRSPGRQLTYNAIALGVADYWATHGELPDESTLDAEGLPDFAPALGLRPILVRRFEAPIRAFSEGHARWDDFSQSIVPDCEVLGRLTAVTHARPERVADFVRCEPGSERSADDLRYRFDLSGGEGSDLVITDNRLYAWAATGDPVFAGDRHYAGAKASPGYLGGFLEKAITQRPRHGENPEYPRFDAGTVDPFDQMFGKGHARGYSPADGSEQDQLEALRALLARSQPVVAGATGFSAPEPLVPGHCYPVLGLVERDGEAQVRLAIQHTERPDIPAPNPLFDLAWSAWQPAPRPTEESISTGPGEVTVPLKVFRQRFHQVTWCAFQPKVSEESLARAGLSSADHVPSSPLLLRTT
jgi:hypothetical protein